MRKRKAGRMRERRWDEKEEGWENEGEEIG